jgi:ADP-glucose pyrophosphorylase
MTIESHTDLDIQVAISNCFNANHTNAEVNSGYQLLQKYLRQTHGFTHDQVDEVVDRIEEQVAEHEEQNVCETKGQSAQQHNS